MPSNILGSNWYACGRLDAWFTAAYLYQSTICEYLLAAVLVACSWIASAWLLRLVLQGEGCMPVLHSASHQPHEESVRWTREALTWTVWLIVVMITASPTFLYVAAYSLPSDNKAFNPQQWGVEAVTHGIYPAYMLMLNSVFYP